MIQITWEDYYQYFFIEKNRKRSKNNIANQKLAFKTIQAYFNDKDFNKKNTLNFIQYGESKKWSLYYINNFLKCIRNIGKILNNPFPQEIILRKTFPKREPLPTPREVEKLAECYIQRPNRSDNFQINFRYRAVIYTQYFTCCRIDELCSLKWTGVLHDCIILDAETTKSLKERVIEIEPFHYNLLMELKALRLNDVYVFGSKKGQMDDSNLNQELKRRANLIGYTKPIHTHLFRKAGATHLGEQGVPLDIISDMLGHSDVNTTKRFYMIHSRAAYRSAVRKNPLLQQRLDVREKIDQAKQSMKDIFADVDHTLFKDALSIIMKELT